jgi:DNA helicase-2/ATP-dependent DNA helicase PcrA
MQYTLDQHEAIRTIDQNLQILACAGAGKTQVIAARVVEMLKAGGRPEELVAFTFTRRAAGELKNRIHRLCLDQLGSDQGLGAMFVNTIHSYCLHLLQSPPVYKYLKYQVLTEVQQRLLIDRYSVQSGLTQIPLLAGGKLERWKDSRLYQQLLSLLEEGQVDLSQVPEPVLEAVERYHALMHAQCAFDYTLVLSEAVRELRENQALRAALADQVRYLIVDEYQDVNPLQEQLISELQRLGANLCVVGDDDQTIYQWRGSDVSNILTFAERYPGVKQIPLNANFRSSTGVVQAARRVIEKNPERLPKQMQSTNAQPFARGDLLARHFRTPAEEAAWIAGKIQAMYGVVYQDWPGGESRGLSYADCAILLRSVRWDAGPILAALDVAGIPYTVAGMNGLFETPEIRACCALFYYLADFCPPGTQPVIQERLIELLQAARLGLTSAQLDAGLALLEQRKALIGRQQRTKEIELQRLYQDLLTAFEVREETITRPTEGKRSGELVFANLGKFSQVISDFEHIHFASPPGDLYQTFARFLCYNAPAYYPEGWEDERAARPDAVQVLTVHQAKGMQWPVVFIPCLRRNRFPSRRQSGRSVWHIIPEQSVRQAGRYRGALEDERRLFYVALTRAEKYLFCSWAPLPGSPQQQHVSPFLLELTASEQVLTREPLRSTPALLPARPRLEHPTLELTFSELKYYYECPYLFKLRFLYGFDEPVNQALGYGKALHNALAEIHAESLRGHIPTQGDLPRLLDRHLHLPFANAEVQSRLRRAAEESVSRYLLDHRHQLHRLEHVEKTIELKLEEGIVVSGRIDLIRRTDTNEIVIVDFKSAERAQAEDATQKQLHIYVVGYEQLTGRLADLIEVYDLDRGGIKRELIDEQLLCTTVESVRAAGRTLRNNHLPRLATWNGTCARCQLAGLCRTQPGQRTSALALLAGKTGARK